MPGPSGKPLFHIAPFFGVVPARAWFDGTTADGYFEDSDAVWHRLLSNPEIGRKEGSCLRGAVFHEDAMAPTQLNVDYLDGLVLDVDEFPNGQAYSFDDIVRRLFGHRFILWTTYNSTPQFPRYRLILPLARPVPRRQFKALWELVNGDLGKVVGHKQHNADRLGYLPRLQSEAVRPYYAWAIHQGPYFDPFVRYGELPETPDRVVASDVVDVFLDRSEWVGDDEALAKARAYMRNAHVGVLPGARHHKLFEKSCQLWWDFYLNEEQVRTVLLEVNSRFSAPKQPAEVLKEVEAGFAWARGHAARKQTTPAGSKRARPPAITLTALKETARKLRRRGHDLSQALVSLADGAAITTRGEDIAPTLRGLARLLGELYVDHDPRQLVSLLQGQYSILAPYGVEMPGGEHLVQLCLNRQEETKNNRRRAQENLDAALASQIIQATGGRRDTPYTLDEFLEYARAVGVTHESLIKRLIIAYGPSYFFFLEGDYSPGIEHNVEVAAQQYLSLAQPFGVELSMPTASDGVRTKKMNELLADYGSIALEAVYSFSERKSRYDARRRAFIFAQAPLRGLEPFRFAEVEDYLNIIGSEDLLDWLAHSPNLERPARLLYLFGPKDCGKSWLPRCLSRLWTTLGPSNGDSLFRSFNEGIGRCPLVFMDETLPDELRGSRGTELLRSEISETHRPLTMKFKKEAVIQGALRFVFSANGSDHIHTANTLTKEDADAIADRITPVALPQDASRFLTQTLGYERVARWFHDDVFARHVLWLRETRALGQMDRFGPVPRVLGNAASNVHAALRFSGATQTLLEQVYHLLLSASSFGNAVSVGWNAEGYGLLVCRDELVSGWTLSGSGLKPPPQRETTTALSALTAYTASATFGPETKRVHVLDLDLVYRWLQLRGLDRRAFDTKLAAKAKSPIAFTREAGAVR